MANNKIVQNAKWIIICKIIQSLLQMLIGMLSARYLGPSNYGLINYAASVVAFAVPFMQLGLAETLVQEYISAPEKEGEILGTCLVMNLASSIACIVGVTSFAAIVNPGERTTILVCLLYSVSLLFQAVEMIKYWFQAKLLSQYSSLAMLVAYVVVSLYKIYLLIWGKNVFWFALSHAVEYCATGFILVIAYKHVGGIRICFSAKTAANIFSRSKYYITASLMVTVFQNTDHVMLKLISGNAENGYYSAAITCTIIVSFVYSAIIDSARPVILESKQISQKNFEENVVRLYSVIIYMTLVQSLFFTLLAKLIVLILYGAAYLPAVAVLRIMVWQSAFSYMGTVRNIWILGEEKYNILWRINLLGAVANVVLNYWMIPLWGACGAALASVLTQIFTNFILGFLIKPIRRNNDLLLKGLNPKLLVDLLRAQMH